METTLSGKNYLQMMKYAKGIDPGIEIVLIYIGTESAEISSNRQGCFGRGPQRSGDGRSSALSP